MPRVTLSFEQLDQNTLPPLCMVWAQPASCSVTKVFSQRPEWVEAIYYLPGGIVAAIIADVVLSKRRSISCPMCHRHRNHWRVMTWWIAAGWFVSIIVLAALGSFAVGLLEVVASGQTGAGPYIGLIVGATAGLAFWLAAMIYLAQTRISAGKITDETITLRDVAQRFAQACQDSPTDVSPTVPVQARGELSVSRLMSSLTCFAAAVMVAWTFAGTIGNGITALRLRNAGTPASADTVESGERRRASVYEFTVGETAYRGHGSRNREWGEKVAILYLPGSPEANRPTEQIPLDVFFAVFVTVSVPLILLVGWLFWRYRYKSG